MLKITNLIVETQQALNRRKAEILWRRPRVFIVGRRCGKCVCFLPCDYEAISVQAASLFTRLFTCENNAAPSRVSRLFRAGKWHSQWGRYTSIHVHIKVWATNVVESRDYVLTQWGISDVAAAGKPQSIQETPQKQIWQQNTLQKTRHRRYDTNTSNV